MTDFWLARGDDAACTEYGTRETMIQAVLEDYACPTQILRIVVGASAEDRTEEIARAAALAWVNKADDDRLEAAYAPEFVQANVEPSELDAIIADEIMHRKDETEHREEISSPEKTGRI